jgi:hypothetical protein
MFRYQTDLILCPMPKIYNRHKILTSAEINLYYSYMNDINLYMIFVYDHTILSCKKYVLQYYCGS